MAIAFGGSETARKIAAIPRLTAAANSRNQHRDLGRDAWNVIRDTERVKRKRFILFTHHASRVPCITSSFFLFSMKHDFNDFGFPETAQHQSPPYSQCLRQ